MKFLEEFGVKKIQRYYTKIKKREERKRKKFSYLSVSELFASSSLYTASFIAFLIGFLCTLPIISLELEYNIFNLNEPNYLHITLYFISLILLLFVEFYLLFLLGFYAIAYTIFHLHHIKEINAIHLNEKDFLMLFSRTIMELNEEKITQYPINHSSLNNFDILLFSLLYKLKVMLSNFLLKFITKRLLTRSSFRLYTPYIATLGTGIWDAVVFYKTIKHAHYKIMVRYTIDQLIKHKLPLLLQTKNTQAILARYYYYGQYSHNFDYLLDHIAQHKEINYTEEIYLEETNNQKANQKLLLLLLCFQESIPHKKERQLIKSLNQKKQMKTLKKYLQRGNINEINAYISQL